jgi:hypothetical protein
MPFTPYVPPSGGTATPPIAPAGAKQGFTPYVPPSSPQTPAQPPTGAGKGIFSILGNALSKPIPKIDPVFTAGDGESAPEQVAKTVGNIPVSTLNAATGIIDFLNPVKNVKGIYDAGAEMGKMSVEGPDVSFMDWLKEIPSAAKETLLPPAIQLLVDGDFDGARKSLEEDPAQAIIIEQLARSAGKYAKTKGASPLDIVTEPLKETAGAAAAPVGKAMSKAGDIAASVASDAAAAVTDVAGMIPGKGIVSDAASLAKQTGKKTAGFVGSIPERMKASAEAGKTAEAVMSKEAPAVQDASRFGIRPNEARLMLEATPEHNALYRKMVDSAKRMEAGEDVQPSADVGGSVVTGRLKEMEAARKTRGEAVGAAADAITGTVDTAKADILARLRKVRGLEKLQEGEGGLDFSKTGLSTVLSKADRNVIEDLYRQLANEKDPAQLNLVRQELFEDIGGRKKANVVLTETREQAIEAIRQGLADSIERVSPEYKNANKAYAEVADLTKRIRKFYNGLDKAEADILDENGGLLLRRLTSNLGSGPKLRMLFDELDALLAKEGKPNPYDYKKIQDFENLLEREYDIAKQTALTGQVSLGIDKSLGGLVAGAIGKVAKAVDPKDARRAKMDELLSSKPMSKAAPAQKKPAAKPNKK